MMQNKQPYNFIKDEEGNEWAIKNEAYWKSKALERYYLLLKRSGIPEYYWYVDWKDYKGEKSKINFDKVLYYAQNFYQEKFNHVHLYLWGSQSSVQKTAICCNVGKEAIRQGYKVRFILGGSLINKLMKLQGFKFNQEIHNYIESLKHSDMLLIDDLFNEESNLLWKNSSNNTMIISEWNNFFREVVSSSTKIVLTSNMEMIRIKELYSELFYELIDRNFIPLLFEDSIKTHKKKQFDNLFK